VVGCHADSLIGTKSLGRRGSGPHRRCKSRPLALAVLALVGVLLPLAVMTWEDARYDVDAMSSPEMDHPRS